MKYSSETSENRTRDLPACSAVPQPTAPPRATFIVILFIVSLDYVYINSGKWHMPRQSEEILILAEIMLYPLLSTTNILFLRIIYQTPARKFREEGGHYPLRRRLCFTLTSVIFPTTANLMFLTSLHHTCLWIPTKLNKSIFTISPSILIYIHFIITNLCTYMFV